MKELNLIFHSIFFSPNKEQTIVGLEIFCCNTFVCDLIDIQACFLQNLLYTESFSRMRNQRYCDVLKHTVQTNKKFAHPGLHHKLNIKM